MDEYYSFEDTLDIEIFKQTGLAELSRKPRNKWSGYFEKDENDTSEVKIVAKGITAFLAFDNLNAGHSYKFLAKENAKIDLNAMFGWYYRKIYAHCQDVDVRENRLLKHRKSKVELLEQCVKSEEEYSSFSEQYFESTLDCVDGEEKDIINEIKEAAKDFNFFLHKKLKKARKKAAKKAQKELKDDYHSVLGIKKEYVDYWMALTKKHSVTEEPIMTEDDVTIFLKQAFGEEPVDRTFNPDIDKIELQHGAWLFNDEFKFQKNKNDITRIMIDNFPELFDKSFKSERDNIRECRYNKSGEEVSRLFKRIPKKSHCKN